MVLESTVRPDGGYAATLGGAGVCLILSNTRKLDFENPATRPIPKIKRKSVQLRQFWTTKQ